MFPVFSLVLDQDVKPEMALLYPELYKDLTKVRPFEMEMGIILYMQYCFSLYKAQKVKAEQMP